MSAAEAPEVEIVGIEGTKTQRVTCKVPGCDWMETAGSPSAASRKKNTHVAEHRASTEGIPEVPTIMDVIEGRDHVPPVEREPVPVVDSEYFQSLRAEIEKHICQWCSEVHEGGPENCNDVGQKEAAVEEQSTWSELPEQVPAWTEVPEEPKNHWAEFADTHTRKSTSAGPDYCDECSAAIDNWVEWPCEPAAAKERAAGELKVALTRSRLAAQRGSSDRDRDAWLAERAQSVSATLVAKLGAASDANVDFVIAQQVAEKINGSKFTGNGYTEWGKAREPHLEAAGLARHGIEAESHLFFARSNPRHSASPDGIAIHPMTGAVCLGEYKTSGKMLDIAKVHSNGYYDQIQWQLHVLEGSHAWLMWEWRHDDGAGNFRAEPGGEHLIMRDDERIAVLVERADRFLAALDAERERLATQPEVEVPEILLALVSNHLAAKMASKRAEEDLRAYCEANGLLSLDIPGVAKVSYSWGSPRKSFDKEAFEEAYPGVYETFLREGAAPERATLRVTAAKGDAEE